MDTPRVLLELRADVNAHEEFESTTALIRAAEYARVGIWRLLLEARAQVNQQQRRGRTALVCACFRDHLEVAGVLVEAEADVNVPDNLGMTALSWTSGAGHVEVARLLLQARAAALFFQPKAGGDCGGDLQKLMIAFLTDAYKCTGCVSLGSKIPSLHTLCTCKHRSGRQS